MPPAVRVRFPAPLIPERVNAPAEVALMVLPVAPSKPKEFVALSRVTLPLEVKLLAPEGRRPFSRQKRQGALSHLRSSFCCARAFAPGSVPPAAAAAAAAARATAEGSGGVIAPVAGPLFREHLLAFELTSILLLAAIVLLGGHAAAAPAANPPEAETLPAGAAVRG